MSQHSYIQQNQQQTSTQNDYQYIYEFGANSEIQAALAQSVPFSTMVANENNKLCNGMRDSEAVEVLQEFLDKQGYDIIKIDGWFGNNTESCVRQFQKDHGLYVDGWVGPKTAAYIDTVMGSAPSSGSDSTVSPEAGADTGYDLDAGFGQASSDEALIPEFDPQTQGSQDWRPPSPWLQIGAYSESVSQLQGSLLLAGFNPGPIDKDFGSMTKAALAAFQEAANISIDGRYGPQTEAALCQALGVSPLTPAQAVYQPPQQNEVSAEGRDFSANPNPAVVAALQWSLGEVGSPYFGGASPYRYGQAPGDGGTYQMDGQQPYVSIEGEIGYDCSGLVIAIMRNAGITLEKYSSTQMLDLLKIDKDKLLPGDILAKSGHVAVYLGNNEVIESVPAGVRVVSAQDYMESSEYSGHRPWSESAFY